MDSSIDTIKSEKNKIIKKLNTIIFWFKKKKIYIYMYGLNCLTMYIKHTICLKMIFTNVAMIVGVHVYVFVHFPCNFHRIGPLGRFGLVVPMSVRVRVYMFVHFPCNFFRGLL